MESAKYTLKKQCKHSKNLILVKTLVTSTNTLKKDNDIMQNNDISEIQYVQKVKEHRSERNEITSSQLTDTGEFNKENQYYSISDCVICFLKTYHRLY